MKETFDLQDYLTKGVERVVADAVKATMKNPKESAYMQSSRWQRGLPQKGGKLPKMQANTFRHS